MSVPFPLEDSEVQILLRRQTGRMDYSLNLNKIHWGPSLGIQSKNAIQSTIRRLLDLQGGIHFSKTLVNYPDENPELIVFGVEVF